MVVASIKTHHTVSNPLCCRIHFFHNTITASRSPLHPEDISFCCSLLPREHRPVILASHLAFLQLAVDRSKKGVSGGRAPCSFSPFWEGRRLFLVRIFVLDRGRSRDFAEIKPVGTRGSVLSGQIAKRNRSPRELVKEELPRGGFFPRC